jgi:hypothetical protein
MLRNPLLFVLLLLVRCIRFFGEPIPEEDVQLPPLLDSDDIAYFFENRDMDGLHWALKTVFERGERNPDAAAGMALPLPEQLIARGGGLTYTTAYKLQHDLEQAEYLADILQDVEESNFFRNIVAPTYRRLLDESIPPLNELKRTLGLYPFTSTDRQTTHIDLLYNKALYMPDLHELAQKDIPLINPELDTAAAERQWFGEESAHKHPGIIIVDDLLSPEAVSALQRILWESTVWYQTKLPLKFGGYVGAYIDDGLHDRILLQLATELADGLPRILKGHQLKYLWAYKYDSEYTGINLHADQAAVNVNIWLTPDEANLDAASGGLIVFTAKPPEDWDFVRYNTDTELVREQLLRPTDFANVTVPYRCNRAVIFDSALFHQTDIFKFRKGYTNRRINLTLLFGDMKQGKDIGASKDEL